MTDRSEGRIIADNPAALEALLRDDSLADPYVPSMSQDPEKKVYVDWPDNDDDDDYRFVSSRIDDIPDQDTERITPVPQYSSAKPQDSQNDRYNSAAVLLPRRGSYTVDEPKTVPSASKYPERDQPAPERRNESFVINDSRSVPSASKYPNEPQPRNSAKARNQSFVVSDSRTIPSASKYPDEPQQIRNNSFVVQNPRSVPSAGKYDREPLAPGLAPGYQSRNRDFYDSLDGPPLSLIHI